MTGATLVGAVVLWIVPIFVANAQGKAKNRAGIWYGLLLGWLGVIVLALLPALAGGSDGTCPWCGGDIPTTALVCRHCRRDVTPLGSDGEPDYARRTHG